MITNVSFDELLKQCTDRAGVAALLRELGLPCDFVPAACDLVDTSAHVLSAKSLHCVRLPSGFVVWHAAIDATASAEMLSSAFRRMRAIEAASPALYVISASAGAVLSIGSFGLDGELRFVIIDTGHPRGSDVQIMQDMVALPDEGPTALTLRHARALDRSRITLKFFREFQSQRLVVARAWTGIPAKRESDREQLALLLLCRLMFLYFLQRSGHLAGDVDYIMQRVRAWQRQPGRTSFYKGVLHPLFFAALNRRFEHRRGAARRLGAVPYLNGGLFDRHAIEREYVSLDLPDNVSIPVIEDFLERYTFTARESSDALSSGLGDSGIDPEMLGRVFEGLMNPDKRSASGTFFTPAAVVDRLVSQALASNFSTALGITRECALVLVATGDPSALTDEQRITLRDLLRRLKVLDPACGSGAFLLGVLARVARLESALSLCDGRSTRRRIIGECLFGVDVQQDAALLCALRLWLTLTVEPTDTVLSRPVPPLPNLDRKVRQGDALIDPLVLASGAARPGSGNRPAERIVRRALSSLTPLAQRYLRADPAEKPKLQKAISTAERTLASAWLDLVEQTLSYTLRERLSYIASTDLFGQPPADAAAAHTECSALRRRLQEIAALRKSLDTTGTLPFFSFPIHFPEATSGFDLVVSNPPWIRSSRWPPEMSALLRKTYRVCNGGWSAASELTSAPEAMGQQVDMSLLFLERSVDLTRDNGTLAMLLPAKTVRSLYGAGARRMLLKEARVTYLEDHSLDQRSIFHADAFTAAVVATKTAPDDKATDAAPVHVEMLRRGVDKLTFGLERGELPLFPRDAASPWLIAPPDVVAALRHMQTAGEPLARTSGLHVRRGVFTGANEVLLFDRVEARLSGLSRVRTEAHNGLTGEEAHVELSAVRAAVRGRGINAWSYQSDRHLLWLYDDATCASVKAPPRTARFLARHADTLEARSGWHTSMPRGCVFRVTPELLAPKVAWQDLSDNLNAVALPQRIRMGDGIERALIPLNTVYFIPTISAEHALVLAGILNSLPVRTFARAIAERAKDARFRFFAWVVSVLPLPVHWQSDRSTMPILQLARAAHAAATITREQQTQLDCAVAALYGLGATHMAALAAFDRWLRGEREP